MVLYELRRPEELEHVLLTEMQDIQKTKPFIVSRILDTKSAGNIVAKTPADFYAVYSGNFTYIEAKLSTTVESLKSGFANLVKNHQLASARLAKRAGGAYYIVFYSALSNKFELWDGAYCAEQRAKGLRLSLENRIVVTHDLNRVLNHMFPGARNVRR